MAWIKGSDTKLGGDLILKYKAIQKQSSDVA